MSWLRVPPFERFAFAAGDGSVVRATALQRELATQVRLLDEYPPLRRIAGLDVGFEDDGAVVVAAAVLLDAASLKPLAHKVVRQPTPCPYVPGLLSLRELPAGIEALSQLGEPPDLVCVDGQGISHPRRLGIAAHLGVATDLPTVGVAKSILCGRAQPPGLARGAHTPLIDRGQQIGWLLRSRANVAPVIVSPGHRVSMDGALSLVQSWLGKYRLPEPTWWADRVASRRGER